MGAALRPLSLLAAAWLLAACGGETDAPPAGGDPAGEAADSVDGAVLAQAAALPFLARVVDDGSADRLFPHAPHRDRTCRSCHEAVPDHGTHPGVECVDCHARPESYLSRPAPTRRECMECHHEPTRSADCRSCHAAGEVPAGSVDRTLTLSVWAGPRERTMPFDHRLHDGEACGACHGAGVFQAVERACGSCHDAHHRPEAACGSCHARPDSPMVHSGEAHSGCAGSGCHDASRTAGLTATRALCLICHEAQTNHEAGSSCVDCHQVNPLSAGAVGRGR